MEKHLYICEFCQKEFEPTRRKVQKFCSDTCRSKNHHHKNKLQTNAPKRLEKKKNEIEKMSVSGVANAATGALIAQGVSKIASNVFVSDDKKPATKKDILELKKSIETRYLPIINYQDPFNRKAFYDKETCEIVLYNEQMNRMELPM